MKRILFAALVCGLATLPALGAPSLGFWEEGAQGSIHMLWDLGPGTVLEVIPRTSFDVDPSQAVAVPAGIVHSAIAAAIVSGTNVTFSNGVFSSSNPIEVHLKMHNFPNANALKEVWVNALGTGAATIEPTGVLALDGVSTSFTYTFLPGPGPGTGADFGWRIQPNPFYEEVEFTIVPVAGTLATLSGMHVDTICIPAPGAFLLAGLGAAAVGWLRTRRSL